MIGHQALVISITSRIIVPRIDFYYATTIVKYNVYYYILKYIYKCIVSAFIFTGVMFLK